MMHFCIWTSSSQLKPVVLVTFNPQRITHGNVKTPTTVKNQLASMSFYSWQKFFFTLRLLADMFFHFKLTVNAFT